MKQLKQSDIKLLREELLLGQGGRCMICDITITNDGCLDHQHRKRLKGTGQIRFVLCRNCNAYLGKVENNSIRFCIGLENLPDRLRRIADCLEMPHLDYIHPSEKAKEPVLSKRCFNALVKAYSIRYPKRKPPQYPKSKKLTKTLSKVFDEFGIVPLFLS